MEIVESAMASALIVAIQMGMPVSILFIIGYFAYRAEGRARVAHLGSTVVGLRGGTRPPTHCWDARQCSSERRIPCPAYQHPEMACWQAIKQSLGRLKTECLNCERCVAPPAEK